MNYNFFSYFQFFYLGAVKLFPIDFRFAIFFPSIFTCGSQMIHFRFAAFFWVLFLSLFTFDSQIKRSLFFYY